MTATVHLNAQAFVYRDTPATSSVNDHGAVVRLGELSIIFMGDPADQVAALDALRSVVLDARLVLADKVDPERNEPDGPPDSYWQTPDDSAYREQMRDAGRVELLR